MQKASDTSWNMLSGIHASSSVVAQIVWRSVWLMTQSDIICSPALIYRNETVVICMEIARVESDLRLDE